MRVVSNPARVWAYVRSQVPLPLTTGMKGLGLERGGRLVAGVLYENFNAYNVWMHVAAQPGGHWLNRAFLRACFAYPFEQLGLRRVSAHVDDSNAACRRFIAHLGFEREATLRGAAVDGGDVGLYVMWRRGCRFVEAINGQ